VRDLFRRAGIDTAELDARLFAELAFGMDRLELVNRERSVPTAEQLKVLEAYAARRLKGEPVSRIIGEREFWGLNFKLNDATLVPRPETEMLVERGVQLLGGQKKPRVLDLGTGTGCIAISLLSEIKESRAVAVDLSPDAVAMARANADRLGVGERFDVRQGSWFEPVAADERFDLIVSNPPYIETATIETLMIEVKAHDPRLALDGGPDGLAPYRIIAAAAASHLKPEGTILFEIGSEQGRAVVDILAQAGFDRVEVARDLAGLDRMVQAQIARHS
jgi:release factor glutamine methyltransferase